MRSIAFYPRYVWGKRYRPLRLGYVVRGLLTQSSFFGRYYDNTRVVFRKNAVVLLKKREVFKSQTFYGPFCRLARKRRYEALFEFTV